MILARKEYIVLQKKYVTMTFKHIIFFKAHMNLHYCEFRTQMIAIY